MFINDNVARSLTFLIETSLNKHPNQTLLGNADSVLNPNDPEYGHIA